MKTPRLVAWTALATFAGLLPLAHAQNAQTITIRAARVFDGREKVLSNAVVEVEGSKIVAIDHFGPDGKYPPSK